MYRRTRRCLTIFFMVIAVLALQILGFGTAVSAITNGQTDGDDHPYVCLVVFDVGGGPAWRTTGVLISPTVVLTAGHGTFETDAARIWLVSDIADADDYPFGGGASSIEAAEIHTNPDYRDTPGNGLKEFDYRDVGVLILEEAVLLDEYGELPEVGLVDTLKMKTDVDLVGYGVNEQARGVGLPPYYTWDNQKIRYFAPAQMIKSNSVISDEFLTLTANPGQGKGGTAFGDSGGPILLAGSNTILALNSFVTNANCSGVTYANRIDIEDILDWIEDFLD